MTPAQPLASHGQGGGWEEGGRVRTVAGEANLMKFDTKENIYRMLIAVYHRGYKKAID